MRVVSKKSLAEFWGRVPEAKEPLEAWYVATQKATWANFAEVKARFPQTDFVASKSGQKLVFDVRGNRYRIVCIVRFDRQALYVLFVGTHAEYDRLDVENL